MAEVTQDTQQGDKGSGVTAEDVSTIGQHADKLYADNKWHEVLEYLEQYADTEDPDLLWRLMRINFRVGKHITADRKVAEQMAARAMELSERALRINDKHFLCQKWTGIVLSWHSELKGQKQRIEKSFQVREHLLKAVELNQEDASAKHLLGRWCFKIASIPWYVRRAASMMFATPPTSTYEEALAYFEAAEKAEPDFYVPNWLYLGKSYYQLGKKEDARKWLKKAAEHQGDVPDDKEACEEAKVLLQKL